MILAGKFRHSLLDIRGCRKITAARVPDKRHKTTSAGECVSCSEFIFFLTLQENSICVNVFFSVESTTCLITNKIFMTSFTLSSFDGCGGYLVSQPSALLRDQRLFSILKAVLGTNCGFVS